MKNLRELVSRMFSWAGSERDLDDEIQFHLRMETDRLLRLGLEPAEARRQAHRGFGGLEMTKEAYRDQRGLPWLQALLQDARYAARMLRHDPGFSLVAVLTLALGIGANTAIFSVVNGVLLKPLPFEEPDRIVTVWENFSAQGGPEQEWIEVPNFFAWRAETDVFEALSAFGFGAVNLTGVGEPQRVNQAAVSADFFATFAVLPALGRTFNERDDRPGADPVALLAHGFWVRVLGADAGVVGKVLTLNGTPTTVIGVLPEGFAIPQTPAVDVWQTVRLDPTTARRGNFFLQAVGRLKPDVSIEQAEAALDRVMVRIGTEYPSNRGVTIDLVPLLDQVVGPVRPALFLLLGIVGFVLLITCANIANLLLSRNASRGRELAVRAAMGAGQGRLVRQLLTESLVLSVLGAAVGLALAYWGTGPLLALAPSGAAPRLDNVGLDPAVLLFTLGVAVLAGVVFGLAPAVHSYRRDVNRSLRDAGRGTQDAARGARTRSVLAVVQVALALCLLIASGLALRSFRTLLDVNAGFSPDGVTTAVVSMSTSAYAGAPELAGFVETLLDRVSARPGMDVVAAVSVLPLSGNDSDTSFVIEGRPPVLASEVTPVAWYRRVTPAYFDAMRIPILSGRAFTAGDRAGAPPVVLISDAMASRFWPGEDALGRRIAFGDGVWHTIVGIAQGVRHGGLDQEPRPELYFPYAQRPGRFMTVVVRSSMPGQAVADLLRSDLRELDPDLPLSNIGSMDALVEASVAQPRFFMGLTSAFGVIALLLASVGVYGVVAYSVSRRTVEVGLRMALGASRRDVLFLVMRQGVTVTGAGLAAGLVIAFWATSAMASVLFAIDPRDLLTFAAAPIVLGLIAGLACLVPAWRATRIDPGDALRA